jgi:hypothetical protein
LTPHSLTMDPAFYHVQTKIVVWVQFERVIWIVHSVMPPVRSFEVKIIYLMIMELFFFFATTTVLGGY